MDSILQKGFFVGQGGQEYRIGTPEATQYLLSGKGVQPDKQDTKSSTKKGKTMKDRYARDTESLDDNPAFNVEEPDESSIRRAYRGYAQSQVDAIRSTFDKYIQEDTQAKRDLISRAYLGNLASGLAFSPEGGANETKAAEKGQERVGQTLNEMNRQITEVYANAELRASEEFRARREEFLTSAKDRYTEEQRISSNIKDTALKEIELFASARSYDEWTEEAGAETVEQYMEETGLDETALKAYFLNANKDSLLSDKPEIIGNKAFWFQRKSDGTVGKVEVDLGDVDKKIKDSRLTDNGIQILYEDGTYTEIGSPGNDSETEDPEMLKMLQEAAAALSAGADENKVRQRFLDTYPKQGNLFKTYTKQEF